MQDILISLTGSNKLYSKLNEFINRKTILLALLFIAITSFVFLILTSLDFTMLTDLFTATQPEPDFIISKEDFTAIMKEYKNGTLRI